VLKRRYISILLAAGLLLLFLSRADWRVLEADFSRTAWVLLVLAIAIRFVSLVAASLRWRVLLSPLKRVSLAPIFSATMIGISADTLVAMQSAEVIRPFLLSRWESVPFNSTFATVMVEWFVDLLGILALLIPAAMVFRAGGSDGSIFHLAVLDRAIPVALAGSLLALGILWLLSRQGARIGDFPRTSTSPEPMTLKGRLLSWLASSSQGLEVMRQPERLMQTTFYSMSSSFLIALCAWVVLKGFGVSIPFWASFILLGFIALGGLVPTPGAVGGFHAACQFGLAVLFHVDPARTILPVIGLHFILYVPPALLGIFYASRKGLTLGNIQQSATAARLGG
jgi:uncharacterized protein (TIRG00374 family)